MAYPVTYEAQYQEERNRLTVFFRYFCSLPHGIVGAVLSIGAFFATVGAWFALVITGKYPEGLYNFNAGFARFYARYNAYQLLQTDVFPSFGMEEDPNYPIVVRIPPVQAEYSRAKAFFRGLLAIPVMIIAYALVLVTYACAVATWFVAVITGKNPRALHDGLNLGLSYVARALPYFLLMTEDWPSFSDTSEGVLPPAAVGAGEPAWSPASSGSRATDLTK